MARGTDPDNIFSNWEKVITWEEQPEFTRRNGYYCKNQIQILTDITIGVFELGVRPSEPNGQHEQPNRLVYIGESGNMGNYIGRFLRGNSHKKDFITTMLENNVSVYLRVMTCRSKEEAIEQKDNLLQSYNDEYTWNNR